MANTGENIKLPLLFSPRAKILIILKGLKKFLLFGAKNLHFFRKSEISPKSRNQTSKLRTALVEEKIIKGN